MIKWVLRILAGIPILSMILFIGIFALPFVLAEYAVDGKCLFSELKGDEWIQ